MNIQDGIDLVQFTTPYGYKLFEQINNTSTLNFCLNKIENIIGDDILLVPQVDKHPTHILTASFGEMTMNKKIYYAIQSLLNNKNAKEASGLYFKEEIINDKKTFNYVYIYSDEDLILKRKEFQLYYYSQYTNFLKTGLNISNWEKYSSDIPIKLCNEDLIHKIGK